MPGVRTTRRIPRPSASAPPATGGRLGPRRTTSSRSSSTRTERPCASASDRAASVTTLARLPPNAPPLASGEWGSPPGVAPRRVGFEVGRFDPGGAQARRPRRRRAPRAEAGRRRWCAGPAPCRRRRGPPRGSRRPPTRPSRRVRATSASSGAVSSANPPRPRATSGATRWGPPPRSSPGRWPPRGRARSARLSPVGDVPGVEDRAPAGAPAEVGEEGLLHRGVVVRGGPLRPQPLEPADDPRRAEAALARARGAEGVGPPRPVLGGQPVDGRDRPPRDPARGGHAGDPRLAVHQHGAATALALRAAPVLRRPQVRATLAARRAASAPRSGTSTCWPSTSSCSVGS